MSKCYNNHKQCTINILAFLPTKSVNFCLTFLSGSYLPRLSTSRPTWFVPDALFLILWMFRHKQHKALHFLGTIYTHLSPISPGYLMLTTTKNWRFISCNHPRSLIHIIVPFMKHLFNTSYSWTCYYITYFVQWVVFLLHLIRDLGLILSSGYWLCGISNRFPQHCPKSYR